MKILCSYRQLSHRAHRAAETFSSHRVHREHRAEETVSTTIPNTNCTKRISGQATQSRSQNAIFGYRDRRHKDDVLAQSRRAAETVLTTKTQRHKDGNITTVSKISINNPFAPSRLRGENRSDENISESSVPSVAKTRVAQRPNNKTFVSLCRLSRYLKCIIRDRDCGKFNSVVASSCLSGSGKPSSSASSAALRATSPQRPLNISASSVNSVANNSLFALIPPRLGGKSIGGVV